MVNANFLLNILKKYDRFVFRKVMFTNILTILLGNFVNRLINIILLNITRFFVDYE